MKKYAHGVENKKPSIETEIASCLYDEQVGRQVSSEKYDRITKCLDGKSEMGYDKNAGEMTIVVALLLFLFKFDDSRIFYKNIFIKE